MVEDLPPGGAGVSSARWNVPMWWCYSEVPSKVQLQADRVQKDGITAPTTLDAPGRTQPTPRASRSVGA